MMLEAVTRALRARRMPADLVTLVHGGLKGALEQRGLSLEAQGVKGCTLYYRRTVEDMPVANPPEQESFLFRFQERSLPVGLVAERVGVAPLLSAERVTSILRAVR